MPAQPVIAHNAALEDIWIAGLGFQSWNYPPFSSGINASGLTSQTIYAMALPFRAGQIVSNIALQVTTAAVGTAPTGFFVGLSTQNTMLQGSANLSASTGLTTTGIQEFALSNDYIIPKTGLYYALILMNGTFGTTQPAFGRGGTNNSQAGISRGFVPAGTAGTGQTALPAAAAAVSVVLTAGLNFFCAAT